ncbi:Cna B-type domain-containing protein [Clostridiaceae bacterium OttesenSCG-928-D20]|nr:Cna B-type domain-containing protein [Clostridiaceae bacterium OttesenSCG-928-D20]
MRKLVCIFLTALLLISLAVPAAFAYSPLDKTRLCSLELDHRSATTVLPDVEFELYHLADISNANTVQFALRTKYKDAPVDMNHQAYEDEDWRKFSSAAAAYIVSKNLTADYTGTTGADGKVKFEKLPVGLYLVMAENKVIGEKLYELTPFVIALPSQDLVKHEWVYDTKALTKVTLKDVPPDKIDIEVQKIWNHGENTNKPSTVEIELYKNRVFHAKVTLNNTNTWWHKWADLDSKDADGKVITWTILEVNKPEGYTVSYSLNNYKFTVTNKYNPTEEPTDPPDETPSPTGIEDPDTPTTDAPNLPSPSPSPGTSKNSPSPSDPSVDIPNKKPPTSDLPVTGLLWWPIPLLAICGIGSFILGWIQLAGGKKEDEKDKY